MVMGERYEPAGVDVWAVGVVLFALLTSNLPFSLPPNSRPKALYSKICRADFHFPDELHRPVSTPAHTRTLSDGAILTAADSGQIPVVNPLAKDLVRNLLQPNPKKRITLAGVRQHPWMAGVFPTAAWTEPVVGIVDTKGAGATGSGRELKEATSFAMPQWKEGEGGQHAKVPSGGPSGGGPGDMLAGGSSRRWLGMGRAATGRVLVIGAGSSGLISARHFKEDGWTVSIIEARGDIGGVWDAAYQTARVQNSGEQYRFADFPVPKDIEFDQFPSRDQLRAYFRAYAKHHDLAIRYKTKPRAMRYQSGDNPLWSVTIAAEDDNGRSIHISEEEFEFVVVAVGYGGKPLSPPIAGASSFRGKIFHSTDLSRFTTSDFRSLFQSKNVAILGMGKSAMDLVELASASGARGIHQIARRARWMLPYRIGPIHISHVVMTRAGAARVPKAFWIGIEKLFAFIHGLKKGSPLFPKYPITDALTYSIGVVTPTYHRLVHSNSISFHIPASLSSISEPSTLNLSNGETIPDADVLIFATGSQLDVDFLPESVKRLLLEQDGVHLYRGIIHPDVPRLAFAGFNSSYMHFVTVELGTHWLLAHLRGTLQLPDYDAIHASLGSDRDWKRLHLPNDSYRALTSAVYQQYVDQLCVDMGIAVYRKRRAWGWAIGWVAEIFGQLDPMDFNGVRREIEGIRARRM
ncbi:hypothetical protein HDU93_001243 [Gonapodya sp. JEL0774]|nr:hypothetical protein HDU93_001243 [Gonapodya sp. JEL0774]